MPIGRFEIAIVLGFLGLAGASYAQLAPPAQPAETAPFVASSENSDQWQADRLPVSWPNFTKLPADKPLPAKSAAFKIDNADKLVSSWEAHKAGSVKAIPSNADVILAMRYLLSIDRNDQAFPEAWAAFIKLYRAAKEIGELDDTRRAARIAKTQGVNIGMTQAEVLGSNWGRPLRVNTTVNQFGRHEQWVYHGSNYLYFDNGVLRSIQTGP